MTQLFRTWVAVASLVAGPTFAPADDAGAVLLEEFIFDEAPFPSCHASTIESTDSGLVAAWFGGTHERHPDVGIWVSRRSPSGWSTPKEVATGQVDGTRLPTWNPVLFQPDGGPLLLFYKVGPTPRDWWGMVTTSTDDGQTWGVPRRLPPGVIGPVKNKPVQLADTGELLCPSSSEHDGWRVHFEWTDPHAESWRATGPINNPDEIRAIQPSVLVHPDGVLQAIGRTRSSGLFQAWSHDRGESWGPVSTTGLPNPSSGTDAVTLADGRHVLVYNHSGTYKQRSPLNVAVSKDGRRWDAALVLEDDPHHPAGYSYPAIIQGRDGRVHVTYTWRRERIKYVVLDPDRLTGTPIVDGRWPPSDWGGR